MNITKSAVLLSALCAIGASAADLTYTPTTSSPYYWSQTANWSSGALPGSGDNVLLSDSALGSSPLVVDGSATRTVNELHFQPASGDTTLMEVASGASLTATKLLLGNSGTGTSFNGALARVDNYGTINVAGFFMGRGNSQWATPGTPTIFHNHAGATFSHTGTGTWNFYFSQNGGSSLFINEGAMSNTSGSPLWMGMGQGNSELRIQGNGVFTANGEIRLGHGYPSTSYVVLADNGSITGTGAINVGHGNSAKATGYLILSNDASIVKSSGRINLGTYTAGAVGHLRMNDSASITLNDYLSIGDGASTAGAMVMDGNSVFGGNVVVVASANNSTGTVSLAGNSRFATKSNLYVAGEIARGDGSVGAMSLADTATVDIGGFAHLGGRSGATGTLSLSDTSRLFSTNAAEVFVVGYASGSTGIVDIAGSAEFHAPTIRVGQSTSTGRMTLSDSATLFATNVSIVHWGAATGTLVAGGNSVITNLLTMNIGHSSQAGHDAILSMRGGSVFLDIDPENPNYIQNGYGNPISLNPWRTAVLGRIRGWGKIAFSDPATYVANAATPSGLAHYGQVIADGEGLARDLDFSRFGALNYASTDANPSGTNGWFAVNKGRLRLPRSRPRKTNAAFCVGDCYSLDYSQTANYATTSNRLANTFSATFTGAGTGNYIFADLYATDRDDIPAGLDAIRPDRVISVWRIGLFDDGPEADEPKTPSSFTSAELRIRIPGDEVAGAEKLYVARHDGTVNGKWTIVGRLANPDPKWPVVPARVSAPSAEDWNLGWFAVIDRSTPLATTISFR